ncbi:MAG: DUF697 domain-containing protein [Gaiellales bacterium]
MPKLPLTTLKTMAGAVRDTRGEAEEERPLMLCGRQGPLEALRSALLAGEGSDADAVQLVAVRRLAPGDERMLKPAAVVAYGGEVLAGLDTGTRTDLEVVGGAGRPLLVLLEALDLPSPAVAEAGRMRGIRPDDVLPYRRGRFPATVALGELAERAGGSGPSLARRLPAFRPHMVEHLIETAARRNAKIALAVFVPGADLPALTAVQVRMVLQIGACYGKHISADRGLELLGVLGAGFGFRAIARELLDVVPVAGWAAKSGIAYAGTKTLGRAAVEYFERGAVADVSRLRGLAEGVRVELERRLRG